MGNQSTNKSTKTYMLLSSQKHFSNIYQSKMFMPFDLVTLRTYPKEITCKRKNCMDENNIHCNSSYNKGKKLEAA